MGKKKEEAIEMLQKGLDNLNTMYTRDSGVRKEVIKKLRNAPKSLAEGLAVMLLTAQSGELALPGEATEEHTRLVCRTAAAFLAKYGVTLDEFVQAVAPDKGYLMAARFGTLKGEPDSVEDFARVKVWRQGNLIIKGHPDGRVVVTASDKESEDGSSPGFTDWQHDQFRTTAGWRAVFGPFGEGETLGWRTAGSYETRDECGVEEALAIAVGTPNQRVDRAAFKCTEEVA